VISMLSEALHGPEMARELQNTQSTEYLAAINTWN